MDLASLSLPSKEVAPSLCLHVSPQVVGDLVDDLHDEGTNRRCEIWEAWVSNEIAGRYM